MVNGKAVPLVKRPARSSAEKWDALLYRHGIEGDSQVGYATILRFYYHIKVHWFRRYSILAVYDPCNSYAFIMFVGRSYVG